MVMVECPLSSARVAGSALSPLGARDVALVGRQRRPPAAGADARAHEAHAAVGEADVDPAGVRRVGEVAVAAVAPGAAAGAPAPGLRLEQGGRPGRLTVALRAGDDGAPVGVVVEAAVGGPARRAVRLDLLLGVE